MKNANTIVLQHSKYMNFTSLTGICVTQCWVLEVFFCRDLPFFSLSLCLPLSAFVLKIGVENNDWQVQSFLSLLFSTSCYYMNLNLSRSFVFCLHF